MRSLMCYCDRCIDRQFEECQQKEYVDAWESVEIQPESRYDDRQRESMKDLVAEGTIIAIASGDPGEKNYLLKVTGEGSEILTKRTDDCSSSMGR